MPGAKNPNQRQQDRSKSRRGGGDKGEKGEKQDKEQNGGDYMYIRKSFGDKPGGKGNKRTSKDMRKKGQPKWKNVSQEVEQLNLRVLQETPPSGVLYYKYKPAKEDKDDEAPEEKNELNQQAQGANGRKAILETSDKSKIKIRFSDLPISRCTANGLFKSKFIKMTEVQRASILHALSGRDIVCSARTGSGKTLSYLIPVVECLYRARWTQFDGLGALILVPTRELGMQAFEVLRSFGGLHDLSAALIIGGKDVELERKHIATMNIIIATPGRLIQHLDETSNFDAINLKVLVMDEVDRMLDMGFKREVDEIVSNLPQKMQTLLFSATVTKSLKDLARVRSSKEAEYIQIHDFDTVETRVGQTDAAEDDDAPLKSVTPTLLLHYHMEIPIEDKLDTLFSFLKTHQKQKILVFFSSRKQVRFAYQAFKSLKVSQNLLELHGKQDQNKRTAIYFQFVEKKHAVLFSTDISARGVDFPAVDWVIQVDCPEDTNTYIHRVGRTARYKSKGNALLMLLPSEAKFADKLKQRDIVMKKLATKADKQLTIQPVLEKLNAENRDQMHLAKKACASYLKGVHIMKDKAVFNLESIDPQKLAHSYGLLNAPQLTVVPKTKTPEDGSIPVDKKQASLDRVAKLRQEAKARKLQKQLVSAAVASDDDDSDEGEIQGSDEDSQDEEFFKQKKSQPVDEQEQKEIDAEEDKALPQPSKKAMRKIRPEGPFGGKTKLILDADGKSHKKTDFDSEYLQSLRKQEGKNEDGSKMQIDLDDEVSQDGKEVDRYVAKMKKHLATNLDTDVQVQKKRLKDKRLKVKKRIRAEMGLDQDRDDQDGYDVVLGTPSDRSDDEQSKDGSASEQSVDEESIEEIPLKKRRKTDSNQTGKPSVSKEEKALKLLSSNNTF